MEPLFVAMALTAVAELGDKTQMLAVVLASGSRKPLLILAGIAAGAGANHLLASLAGYYTAARFDTPLLGVGLALSFVVMAAWTLFQPDSAAVKTQSAGRVGFLKAAGAIFLVEMGDKTQMATAAMAARYHDIPMVVMGSTLGMLLADAPGVVLGEAILRYIPVRVVRIGSATAYLAFGVFGLLHAAGR